ncbi:MAG: NAD(P)H-binding protein [Thermodesulfobacteriota bacterium]|nr:NAD(P)H-binding protein [Thermodesulfobacteriota bacterium]
MHDMPQNILLTGPTGFIGGRLLHALDEEGLRVRCLVRISEELVIKQPLKEEPEVGYADLLQPETLPQVMEGMDAAFYLVHSMGGRSIAETKAFAERDRKCAKNFLKAAEEAGVKRIIYLGGLGETGDKLSKHLASRQEVAHILQSGSLQTTALRAAVIIGAGGASFELIRYLAERLPVMMCPRWIDTRSQPIAVQDVISYLVRCLREPATAGETLDIGGPDIVTYREMVEIYARVRGLHRFLFTVPVLTPRLSAYWINLITPVPAGIVFPLVEGLKNEVICRDNRIRDLIPLDLMTMEEAICTALTETEKGPGQLPSQQACFLRQ